MYRFRTTTKKNRYRYIFPTLKTQKQQKGSIGGYHKTGVPHYYPPHLRPPQGHRDRVCVCVCGHSVVLEYVRVHVYYRFETLTQPSGRDGTSPTRNRRAPSSPLSVFPFTLFRVRFSSKTVNKQNKNKQKTEEKGNQT